MNLDSYYFDVQEKPITLTERRFIKHSSISGYKAIVAPQEEGEDAIIAVVKDSYKLVRNKDLIEPFLEKVDALGVEWYIDTSHSFSALNRMRLQITFPELYLGDEESPSP